MSSSSTSERVEEYQRSPAPVRPSRNQQPKQPIIRCDLKECSNCQRRFDVDRIEIHEKICKKLTREVKPFDGSEHRIHNTPMQQYVFKILVRKNSDKKKYRAPSVNYNWQVSHDDFISTIRRAKKGGTDIEDLKSFTNIIKMEKNIIDCPHNFKPLQHSLGYEMFMKMKEHKGKVAQYHTHADIVLTYEELLTKSISTAIKIKSLNLGKDDIICVCSYRQKYNHIPYLAAFFLNMKVVHVVQCERLFISDILGMFKQVPPKLIFVIPEYVELIEDALKQLKLEDVRLVVFGPTDVYDSFDEYIELQGGEDTFKPVIVKDLFETCAIFFSSGCTGVPKAICLHHYGLAGQAFNAIYNGLITSVSMTYMSLYWISSAIIFVASVFSGTATVICPQFDPLQTWHYIDKFRISFLYATPGICTDMYYAGRPENIDTTCLKCLVIGSYKLVEHRMNIFRKLIPGTMLFHVYGQTESSGFLTIFNLQSLRDQTLINYKSASLGKPVSGVKYKVINRETKELCTYHEQGELCVSSKYIMNGYYNRDSSDVLDEHGWLHTGDIVYFDTDFCFYFVDRLSDVLKIQNWAVAPDDIENIVKTHPNVNACVVVGMPDFVDGEHALALVVLKDPELETTSEEIINFVAENASDSRLHLQAGCKVISQIPLNNGLFQRKFIKDFLLRGKL